MDGFTVSNSNRFLNGGASSFLDSKSMKVDSPSIGKIDGVSSSSSAAGASFADTLKEAIGQVNELQKTADKSAQEVATGKSTSIADAMITAEKAEIAFRTMVQVRNKIIDAYQEIMKMQV